MKPFRVLKGLDTVDTERMFPMVGESRTRGHSVRIEGHPFKTEMWRDFFSQRVVNLLPRAAVEV